VGRARKPRNSQEASYTTYEGVSKLRSISKHPHITHLRGQQAFYVCVIMMQKIAIIATCTGFRSKSDLC